MTPGWEHDVFVSYAHADNGLALGSSIAHGWVTALAANLNEGPGVFKKRFAIDHQLKPGDDFGTDLLAKVERSSLLVLLLSQNYIESAWCGKELDHFIRTHAKDPQAPADVFVVELLPYENFTSVPANIQLIRKRLIHAKFWYQPREASAPSTAGYPSALDAGPESRDHYWRVLNELRVALDTRLRELRHEPGTGPVTAPANTAAPVLKQDATRPSLGTVLLADTTDDLEAQRTAVKAALEPEGIVVLPEGDYVGLTPQEFDAAITGDLARADLFVQLLSPTVGRKGKGFTAPLPQLQHQRAVLTGLPILQWCERLPAAREIADAAHAQLFESEVIRATHLADFKTSIVERLVVERDKRQRAAAIALPQPPVSRPRKKLIFVDDVAGEQGLSKRVRDIIDAQNCSVRSLPASAPLGNNGIDVKELLRPCRAGITVYADPAKFALTYNRLVFFLNQIAAGGLELARWGVCLQQDTAASDFGIESDEVVAIDERGLAEFLRGL